MPCYGVGVGESRRPRRKYKIGNEEIGKVEVVKDLEVMISKSLSLERHRNMITGRMYKLLINVRKEFDYAYG